MENRAHVHTLKYSPRGSPKIEGSGPARGGGMPVGTRTGCGCGRGRGRASGCTGSSCALLANGSCACSVRAINSHICLINRHGLCGRVVTMCCSGHAHASVRRTAAEAADARLGAKGLGAGCPRGRIAMPPSAGTLLLTEEAGDGGASDKPLTADRSASVPSEVAP